MTETIGVYGVREYGVRYLYFVLPERIYGGISRT